MQPTPAQNYIFQNLKILTKFAETVDLCIYEPTKKLYITKGILPEDLSYYEIIAGLNHPNLAKIDFIMPYGKEYRVVREYISGDCLTDIIEEGKTYPENVAAQMIYDICSGLSALHQHNIIHRDINPNNIIITSDGCVKIIDYGIARMYKSSQSRDTIIVGTPGYAAPEQYGFSQSDNRTDIYSIGVLMNVLICGKKPMEQTVGGNAGKIIRKCTQMDAGKRYTNVLELMRDIDQKIGIHKESKYTASSNSAADKIMLNIPGIRSGKLYFIIPAVIWYIFIVFITVVNIVNTTPGFINYAVCLLMTLFTFIMPLFCFHNAFDIWNRLPAFKAASKTAQRAFFYSMGVLSIFLGMCCISYLGSLPK